MPGPEAKLEVWRGVPLVSALSLFALAIQGFHPYAEDGGLYAAGIKKVLDPGLYVAQPQFVLAHLRFSPFAATVAAITCFTHLPLPWVLLLLCCGSVWTTLYAGWMIASRCTANIAARTGAVALLACWLTMPIAGTALMLMDPYATARSISTPLELLAIAWALDAARDQKRAAILCATALTLAVVHPLMAAYALATVIVLLAINSGNARIRNMIPWLLAALAIAIAAAIQCSALAESPAYVRAALTRYYWFPARWHWYELAGLAAPLALLWLLARRNSSPEWRTLARMALVVGAISLIVALLFSRPALSTHMVARLQPLRCFQIVYEVLFLQLGAEIGARYLRYRPWRWILLLTALGGIMFAAQRRTYPASRHFEWPGTQPRNPWSEAFLWIRDKTPKNALFALDADYITAPGEDAQSFRGIAERAALPDYSKDGGEASITPALAEAWATGEAAQQNLSRETDHARLTALQPLGVTWVVLDRTASTAWNCPYTNAATQVCRLP